MPGTTPTYALRYPLLSEAPDGPDGVQDLALDVEAQLTRMDTQPAVSVFTSTGSFAKPAGLKYVRVQGQAPGAGSGGAGTTGAAQGSCGAGGGGGESFEAIIPAASLGASTAVTIGAAGLGAAAVGGTGTGGGTVSFGALVNANGGGGGGAINAVGSGVVGGGAGGTGGSGTATNVRRRRGGTGDVGRVGGGEPFPTRGGDAEFGAGAAQGGGTNTSTGAAAVGFGGGGGGAFVRASTAGVASIGDGAPGMIRVEAYF